MKSFILFKKLSCMVFAGLLVACGGGGGGDVGVVVGGGGGGGGGGLTPPAFVASTPTVLASAYVGTVSSPGFWAVTPSTQAGREVLAMNYNGNASSSVSTTLYSGRLQAGENGLAAASALRTMRADGTVRDGTASFTGVSPAGFTVSFDALISSEAKSYSALATAPVDAAAGNWTGRWVDGLNSNTNLTFSWSGEAASFTVATCNMRLTWGSWQVASGLYPVQVDYPATQFDCARQGTQLKGWAFVQQAGSQQTLRVMALDATGSGISFRAER